MHVLCYRSMLYGGSDTIRDIEWVIFDEVHYVNDSEVQKLHVCGMEALLCTAVIYIRCSVLYTCI